MWLNVRLLFLGVIFSTIAFCGPSSQLNFDKTISRIYYLCNEGKLNLGIQKINHLLERKEVLLTSNQRYELYTLRSRIYFISEDLPEFINDAESAFRLKKNSEEIYKGLLYAQKAAYFHYHMIGDSSLRYAREAMSILKRNWKHRKKVFHPFIYQQYANSFMYDSNVFTDKQRYVNHFCRYLDSAILNLEDVSHFLQEAAILHRSKANRMMDIVGYEIRLKRINLQQTPLQKYLTECALLEYDKALNCLAKKEHDLQINITALKSLLFFCTARGSKGDSLLWPVVRGFKRNTISKTGWRLKSSLYALQYFTHYLLKKERPDPRFNSIIAIYKKLLPLWDAQRLSEPSWQKDSYGNSPYLMLSFIYGHLLNENRKNKFLTEAAAALSLENYFYYSKERIKSARAFNRKKYRQFQSDLQSNPPIENFNLNQFTGQRFLTSKDILSQIQQKIKPNEALLIQSHGMLDNKAYFLITINNIEFQWSMNNSISLDALKFNNVTEFKRFGFNCWKQTRFHNFIDLKKIRKIYVAIDVSEPFDLFLSDTTGNDFSELSYVKKKVNIVKIYNPIDFFTHSQSIESTFNSCLINKTSHQKLPYSEKYLLEKSKKHRAGNLQNRTLAVFQNEFFKTNGILHFLGHGSIDTDKISSWQSSGQSKNLKKLSANDTILNDLIILELCYASFRKPIFYPDRDLQNNLISRGAKAVIASPYQTVDQSSAYIFEKFYTYLDQGITAEEALQKAKMDYLKTHKGSLAHPIYWSTYELTTNVKDLRIAPKTKPFPWVWIPIFTFLVGVGGAAWWSLRR